MGKMLELTDESSKDMVMVNFDLVKYYKCLVRPDEPLTVIHFIDKTTITVVESYRMVYIAICNKF